LCKLVLELDDVDRGLQVHSLHKGAEDFPKLPVILDFTTEAGEGYSGKVSLSLSVLWAGVDV
jgi:hypothetical protein